MVTFFSGAVGLCRWSLTHGRLSADDLAGYLANVNRLADLGGKPHVVLDIAHDISLPTPVQRKTIADAVQALPLGSKRLIAGHAVVVNSAIGRGVLTAINWFVSERPFAERVFASPDKALLWLAERLPETSPGLVLADIGRQAPHFRSFTW